MSRRALTEQLPRFVGYRLAYEGIVKPPLPINLTLSVTNLCNSRCRTCDIWCIYPAEKERLAEELTVDELERIFQSIGSVYFFNVSGGEPFLRPDVVEIVRLACLHLKPGVIHIPTNALMPAKIEARVTEMLEGFDRWGSPGVKLTIKPSFDGVGADHDRIRGTPGNYEKLLDTIGRLKRLKQRFPRLGVGVGTVVSSFNVDRLADTIAQARRFQVDTYISEVAEERMEMRNFGREITPAAERYRTAIRLLQEETFRRLGEANGLELVTQGIRHFYYDLTTRWLQHRKQILPCYAGISNVHISAYGEVWPCAILADSRSMGNLKEQGYDFRAIWHSPRADEVRSGIKARQCDCPLANQAYANVLMSPGALAQVGGVILRAKMSHAGQRLRGATARLRPAVSGLSGESRR
ncbi:MAG: radical SAM protein [Bradymonadales bacterium]|nr:radical SAM protein [Bradymonadales bacterium]